VAGILIGFIVGPQNIDFLMIMIIIQMVQMSISMDGLELKKGDVKHYKKEIWITFLCCYLLNAGVTILMGIPFMESHPDVWYGWALFASLPCAISVIICGMYMKGDVKLALVSVTVIYLISLALTPALSYVLIGNAVSPTEILKYIVLFIVIPFLVSLLIKRLHLKAERKTVIINAIFMLLVLFAIAANRSAFFEETMLVLSILALVTIRLVVITIIPLVWSRRAGVDRGRSVVYVSMAAWKNTRLCITMAMVLMPGAVLPCVLSLFAENFWFMIMVNRADKIWGIDSQPQSL
jgi:BASS family bile acid:Na+ symporter